MNVEPIFPLEGKGPNISFIGLLDYPVTPSGKYITRKQNNTTFLYKMRMPTKLP